MADAVVVIDVQEEQVKKSLKRKRGSLVFEKLIPEQIEAQIEGLRKEIDGLFGFYKEVMDRKLDLHVGDCGSINAVIGVLLEESKLPLSKLVGDVYEKVMNLGNGMGEGVTRASVKSSILFVGQRVMYGVPNPDADVLEDDTDSCLWCWETRDVKLMPQSVRGGLKIRRTCRKKIHDRITAVSALITALQKLETGQDDKSDSIKMSEKQLGKVLNEADIRLLVDNMIQKNGADLAVKEVQKEEKLLIKQLEKNKRVAEKEKRRMDREHQKEIFQSKKELKRMQEDLEQDEKRRVKEESEMRKQLRKQQEEAEKEQRRREKEEAELRKQQSVRKQASIMERFLKRNKTDSSSQNDQSPAKVTPSVSSMEKSEMMPEAVALLMDHALSSNIEINNADLFRSHLSYWHHLGQSIRSNRKRHWGIRCKPRTELFKELKLTSSRGLDHDEELNIEKSADDIGEKHSADRLVPSNADTPIPDVKICQPSKQLLQFDKSNRPAFYGIWPKKSHVVGPRHPFRKDPELEYEIDSDEEWEEEEPGESLSDCDKDDEDESFEEGCMKADEDESEDGFFVPDGYLSENEGVLVDRMESDVSPEDRNSPTNKQELESEEFTALLRRKKYLHNLTEHALRKNQPLVILNLMHEKAMLLLSEDLSGVPKLEQTCLQALSMCPFPGGPPIEISIEDSMKVDDQEVCSSNSKSTTTPVSTETALPESELPTIVHAIQSCSQGINKVVESLQDKFPNTPKSQLRNKVREISDFVDNRWQVKKDILNKLGVSVSPEKGCGRTKSIATFFSKRCMLPSDKPINSKRISPQPCIKQTSSVQGQQQDCTYN